MLINYLTSSILRSWYNNCIIPTMTNNKIGYTQSVLRKTILIDMTCPLAFKFITDPTMYTTKCHINNYISEIKEEKEITRHSWTIHQKRPNSNASILRPRNQKRIILWKHQACNSSVMRMPPLYQSTALNLTHKKSTFLPFKEPNHNNYHYIN